MKNFVNKLELGSKVGRFNEVQSEREKEKASEEFRHNIAARKKTFNPSKKKFQIDPKEEKSLLKIIHYLIKT